MSEEKDANQTNDTNIDDNMAIEFPNWDLLPPDTVIKKGNHENA